MHLLDRLSNYNLYLQLLNLCFYDQKKDKCVYYSITNRFASNQKIMWIKILPKSSFKYGHFDCLCNIRYQERVQSLLFLTTPKQCLDCYTKKPFLERKCYSGYRISFNFQFHRDREKLIFLSIVPYNLNLVPLNPFLIL